ncbi:hypothetical protein KI387_017158, partial [Taxus chinensis]
IVVLKLCNLIQDLIDNNAIELPEPMAFAPINENHKLKIFNNPLPKHDKKVVDSSANHTYHAVPPPASGALDFL